MLTPLPFSKCSKNAIINGALISWKVSNDGALCNRCSVNLKN